MNISNHCNRFLGAVLRAASTKKLAPPMLMKTATASLMTTLSQCRPCRPGSFYRPIYHATRRPGIDFSGRRGRQPERPAKIRSTTLEVQKERAIRYTVMSLPDFQYRQQIHDRFAVGIMNAKKQVLVDQHNLLVEDQARLRTKKKQKAKKYMDLQFYGANCISVSIQRGTDYD